MRRAAAAASAEEHPHAAAPAAAEEHPHDAAGAAGAAASSSPTREEGGHPHDAAASDASAPSSGRVDVDLTGDSTETDSDRISSDGEDSEMEEETDEDGSGMEEDEDVDPKGECFVLGCRCCRSVCAESKSDSSPWAGIHLKVHLFLPLLGCRCYRGLPRLGCKRREQSRYDKETIPETRPTLAPGQDQSLPGGRETDTSGNFQEDDCCL